MTPCGLSVRSSSIEVVHGRTWETTSCSRMRRAINWVYCPPKSSTTTPPSSASILPPCSCASFVANFVALSIMPSPSRYDEIQQLVRNENALHDAFAGKMRRNRGVGARQLFDFFDSGVHSNFHFAPQPSIHLYGNFDFVLLRQRFIKCRPGRLP